MSLAAGSQLAHYRITAAIGAGGMGEVYRATDTKLGREVALKVLPAEVAADPERLDRFRREAIALAALDHPGIVMVFSVEEADGVHFLTMQLVEGEPLEALIPEGGMPLGQMLSVAAGIAEALAAAHEKGIVHRDLKPGNVMLTKSGRVKILDFGLAKMSAALTEDSGETDMATLAQTRAGVVMGTVPYMSPEQVLGKPVDARSDIFSLGAMLYEMVSGARPFQSKTSVELMSAILRDTPKSVSTVRPDAPDALDRLISRCLEKDPDSRFQTARELSSGLRALQEQSSSATVSFSRSTIPGVRLDSTRTDRSRRSIEVKPFATKGAAADLEELAGSVTEDITTGLCRFTHLSVVGGASALGGMAGGQREGARYVLEGSVRRGRETVRVNAQLVDRETGAHLWAEAYDRSLGDADLLAVQDEISARIAATVADSYGVLVRAMALDLQGRSDDELTPSDWVVRLFAYRQRIAPGEHLQLREGLERAVDLDPEAAQLHACLAQIYLDEAAFGFNVLPNSLDRALASARRAVELDRTDQLACQVLAQTHFFRRDIQSFRPMAERAMALNPLDSNTIGILGLMIVHIGEFDRGAEITRRAMELNPHHAGWYHFGPIWEHFHNGEYERAIERAGRVDMPGNFWPYLVVAAARGHLGQRAEAEAAVRDLLALDPEFAAHARQNIESWHFASGLLEPLLDGLRKAGLEIPSPAEAGEARGSNERGTTAEPPVSSTSSSARRSREGAGLPSVAVLPFVNMSADPENEYFADGITEDIIAQLAKIQTLRVISRASAMAFKKRDRGMREIGEALGATTLLDGSVRRAGNRVRIVAQLIDVDADKHIWANTYDRDLTDIFAIQTDVALRIAAALQAELSREERRRLEKRPTDDLVAYELYLQGRAELWRLTADGFRRGLDLLEQAVAQDPEFALAYANIARIHANNAVRGATGQAPDDEIRLAKESVSKALALDDELAEAHGIAGFIRFVFDFDWVGAERDLLAAIELSPGNAEIHNYYSLFCISVGRYADGLREIRLARQLDPLPTQSHIATALLRAGRIEEALEEAQRDVEANPDFPRCHSNLGWALIFLGRNDEGIQALERAAALSPGDTLFLSQLGQAYGRTGNRESAQRILEQLSELARHQFVSPYHFAYIYAGLGEHDVAMDWLERAYELRSGAIYGIKGSFLFNDLRDHPRFQALLRKMNL